MRNYKNKRKKKKNKTRSRLANNLFNEDINNVNNHVNNVKNSVQGAVNNISNSVEEAVNNTTNSVEQAVNNTTNQVEEAVNNTTNQVEEVVNNTTNSIKKRTNNLKGGKKETIRCKQRGGFGKKMVDMLSQLKEQTKSYEGQIKGLKEALTNSNKIADQLISPSQNGGKRKKHNAKGGQNESMSESNQGIIDNENTNKQNVLSNNEEAEINNEKKINQDIVMKPEQEKECTGFLDKIFGCKTKSQKMEENKLKECILNCKSLNQSETKQNGGKTKKKIKKRRKYKKNKSNKK